MLEAQGRAFDTTSKRTVGDNNMVWLLLILSLVLLIFGADLLVRGGCRTVNGQGTYCPEAGRQ